MELLKENQCYDKQWGIVDGFYNTNEPEGFGTVVIPDEIEALEAYYFVNSQKQDVYGYREQMTINNSELVKKAEAAARKIAIAEGLLDEEINETFS